MEYNFKEMLRAELEKLLGEYNYYRSSGIKILEDNELQELLDELHNRDEIFKE